MMNIAKLSSKTRGSETKNIKPFHSRLPAELKELELKEILARYNLIGFDEGDGELAACKVVLENGRPDVKALCVKRGGIAVSHWPNILGFLSTDKARLVDEEFFRSSNKVYYNFKKCPGEDAGLHYRNDPGNKTYEELMAHSFGCALKELADVSENDIDFTEKKTVILVGRPASKGWEAAEGEYERILRSKLDTYLGREAAKNITLLVLSESHAAMAGALDMEQKNWLNVFIRILDLGSSTFDITTVTPQGLDPEGEDSFQFGGNKIDNALEANAEYEFYKAYPRKDGYEFPPDPARVARLRFIKEECYGDNGCNMDSDLGLSYSVSVHKNGQPIPKRPNGKIMLKKNFNIDAAQMDYTLHNDDRLPELCCSAMRLTGNAFHHTEEKGSWMEACEYVLRQFREKTDRCYLLAGKAPQRLILTGGVSNMPEVKDLAEEIFGVGEGNGIVAKNPSETVSIGLARILGNEILKLTLLKKVCRKILEDGNGIPGPDSLYEELIAEAARGNLDIYEKIISQWAEGSGSKTLKDCIDIFKNRNNGIYRDSDPFVERAYENWFRNNRIMDKVKKLLQKELLSMFPEFPEEFPIKLSMPDFSNLPQKTLDATYPINIYMFFDENNCPDNPYNTGNSFDPEQRQGILKVFRSHREGLVNGADIRYSNGHRVTLRDDLPEGKGMEFQGNHGTGPTVRSIYRHQLTVKDDAAPLREAVLAALEPQILAFVESITYYLAVTGRK